MHSDANTIVIGLIVSIVALLIEYLVIKPLAEAPTDGKRKLAITVIVVISLVVPVVLLREAALTVSEIIGQSVAARVAWYANLYAFLALGWGCSWTHWIRPWLYGRLQSLVQNTSKGGEERDE
jgi:hypothetical protein